MNETTKGSTQVHKTKTSQLRKLSPKEVYVGKREIEFAFACEREVFFNNGQDGQA